MRVYFAGAEIPEYQDRITAEGATTMALSFRRVMDRPGVQYIRPGCAYWLDHGLTDEALEPDALDSYVEGYIDFVLKHGDAIVGALEFDALDAEDRDRVAVRLVEALGDKVWPVWSVEDGRDALVALSRSSDRLVVVGEGVGRDKALVGLLSSLTASGLRVHVHQVPNPSHVARIRPESVSVGSWNSTLRYGEIIVPRGSGVQRFQPPHKEQTLALAAERAAVLGVDPEAVKANDSDALCRLAIATYMRFENELVTSSDLPLPELVEDDEGEPLANSALEVRKNREPELDVLPVLGLGLERHEEVGEDGRLTIRDVTVLNSSESSHRRCDTCFLSAACPSYVPGNHCAYKLPVELRTKTQLRALVETMVEMQTQRVAFARFSEEVNGGYPDPNVGKELDRLMRMLETKNNLEAERESFTLNMEASKSGGILSALFGQRAERAAQLPGGPLTAEQTDMVIRQIAEQ